MNFRVVMTTRSILPINKKDALPTYAKSNVIYKFTCKRCESTYIGRCNRRLEDRIVEHVPSVIRKKKKNLESFTTTEEGVAEMLKYYKLRSSSKGVVKPLGNTLPKVSKSAVGSHLIENPACAESYDESCFQVVAIGRSKYHVDVLEGIFINDEKPVLCRQKEFVYNLKLF